MKVLPPIVAVALLLSDASVAWAATFADKLVAAARARTQQHEVYDGAYQRIAYPMGDVADNRGVCTDLVIRAYRKQGVDLQVLIHEDMARHFGAYPKLWGMRAPDRNIDHRRVPNIQTFMTRAGAALPVSQEPGSYAPGDLVTWRLPGNLPHIGIVSDQRVGGSKRPKIIHNIGAGPVEDEILFRYPITGHYRYLK
ncbi:MAG: DUF1287 domain-containing protein [Chitinimonas sp.]|nr:DUF1287 domain-containing protein [Chitinimonas sp.]